MKKKMGRPVGSKTKNKISNNKKLEMEMLNEEIHQLRGQVIALENVIDQMLNKI